MMKSARDHIEALPAFRFFTKSSFFAIDERAQATKHPVQSASGAIDP